MWLGILHDTKPAVADFMMENLRSLVASIFSYNYCNVWIVSGKCYVYSTEPSPLAKQYCTSFTSARRTHGYKTWGDISVETHLWMLHYQAFKELHSAAGRSQHSPPTQRPLLTRSLWDFIIRGFLLSLRQTKNHHHCQFITDRIIPEVLAPHRSTQQCFLSSLAPSHVHKRWHIRSRRTHQTMSSLALRLGNPPHGSIGQEIKYTFSTPHPSFYFIVKHFLSSHATSSLWLCLLLFPWMQGYDFSFFLYSKCLLNTWGWLGCIAGSLNSNFALVFWISNL